MNANKLKETVIKDFNRTLTSSGYYESTTGGNCLAFRKDFDDGSYILLTNLDGWCTNFDDGVLAGWYENENDCEGITVEIY